MISILLLLMILSFTLFFFNMREGLENCPKIEGTTTTGLINRANISSIKKKVDDINKIKIQIDNNTSKINLINNQLKDTIDLKQKVNDLTESTKKLKKSLSNLAGNIQSKGFSVANTSKKNQPNPLPHLYDDPHAGKWRT